MSHTTTPNDPGNEPEGGKLFYLPGAREHADAATPAGQAVEGVVVEQLDNAGVEDDPRWQTVPLLPQALADKAVRRHRTRVLRNHAGFHALRLPVYGWRVLRVTGVGARVALRDVWSYQQVGEYGEMIAAARRDRKKFGDDHVAALRKERRELVHARHREPTTILSASGATSYGAALVAVAQVWGVAAAAPVVLPLGGLLYVLGRREMRRRASDGEVFTITDLPATAADAAGQPAVLGADSINAAFVDAGLIKDDTTLTLVGAVRAVQMDAAEARVLLPRTLPAEKVIAERGRLAAALRVDTTWLDITETPEPGVISMWMAASDPLATAAPSPLLDDPASVEIDVWRRGVPLGRNRRGETVHMPFRHVNALLGGTTRSGKGMALRNIVPGLGLDPRVRIRLVVGAKPGEHRAYAPVCSTFFGKRPERLLDLLDAMIAEADRREAVLEDEGRAKFNEKDLDRLPLEVLIIDEFPQYTMSKARILDPSDEKGKRTLLVGEEIEHRLTVLAAYCTALNMDLVLLAQDPDANTVPRGFRNNTGSRTAFRTNSAAQTNAILKDGSTGAGLRAHDIKVSQPGVAIVDLDGAEGELIRTFYVPDDRAEDEPDPIAPVIAEGVARRGDAGIPTGHHGDPIEECLVRVTGLTSAYGGPTGSGRPGEPEGAATGPVGILAELLAVFAAGGDPDRMRTAELLDGLAARDPGTWSAAALGVEPDDTGAYVRVGGAELRRVIDVELDGTGRELPTRGWSAGGRANGYYRADILTAAGIVPK